MENIQQILVYITLSLAVGYLVKKFFIPKRLLATKKVGSKNKSCGSQDCGCH